MEEYLEGSLHKIGPKEKESNMISTQKMIKLGYFLLIIKLNSKLNKTRNNMRSIAYMIICAYLVKMVMK